MSELIEYEARDEDFPAAHALFMKACPGASWPFLLIRVLAATSLLGLTVLLIQQPHRFRQPAVVAIGLLVIYLLFLRALTRKRSLKKLFANIAHPGSTLPILLRFNEAEISFTLRAKSEARFVWSGILGVVENDRSFVLIPGKNQFYYIPKRVLSEADLEKLRCFSPKGKLRC